MAAAFASGTNTYVPSFETSGHLTVAFSRNPKTFPINKYATITPVTKDVGYYLKVTVENAARVLNANLSEMVWPDAADAPDGVWNDESFAFALYGATRYAAAFRLGYLAEQQADWKIEAYYASMVAQQMMTGRTLQAHTLLQTAGSYDTGHSDTATNWSGPTGGFWSAGTSTAPFIKRSLNKMSIQILQDSLGVIQPQDLVLVVNPTVAAAMGQSPEIHDYVKSSPLVEKAILDGSVAGKNAAYGLPDMLYGIPVVIEDTVRVTTAKLPGTAATKAFVCDSNQAYLLARPGELVGQAGGPSFSALHYFMKEEMTVETKDDPDHRRKVGRVVEHYDTKIVASVALCRATNVLS